MRSGHTCSSRDSEFAANSNPSRKRSDASFDSASSPASWALTTFQLSSPPPCSARDWAYKRMARPQRGMCANVLILCAASFSANLRIRYLAQSPIKSCANCTDGPFTWINPSWASSPRSGSSSGGIVSICTTPLSLSPSRCPSLRSNESRASLILSCPAHLSQMQSIGSVSPIHGRESENRCATSALSTQSRTIRLRRMGCNPPGLFAPPGRRVSTNHERRPS